MSTNFNYYCASRPSFVRHQLVLVRVCFVSGVYLVVVALRSALWNQFQQGCFVLLLTPLLVSAQFFLVACLSSLFNCFKPATLECCYQLQWPVQIWI